MRIILLCATRRGRRFLEKLSSLTTGNQLVVFSFREEIGEPPFFEDIRELADSNNHAFYEAKQVGDSRLREFWETDSDLMMVVSWRYIIPKSVYKKPRLGTFVFHDSLLPAYRGFAPTQWAIINGEAQAGVTLFEIAQEVDAGPIVDQCQVPIGPNDYISTVVESVTCAYLDLLESNLPKLLIGDVARYPQDHSKATYTCKRMTADYEIDWKDSSRNIFNLIRASSHPYPGAFTYLSGRPLKVWSAEPLNGSPVYVGRIPGRVVEVQQGFGSVVLSGDGVVLLREVQVGDGPILRADEILNSITQQLGR